MSPPSRFRTLTRNRHNNNFRFVTERLEYSKVRYCFCYCVFICLFYIKVIHLLICDNLKPARAACRLLGFTIAISGDSLYSFTSISTSKSHPHTCTMYMTAPSLHTCCFTSAIPFPSIFTKSPDEIVVEAVDFVEAIVLTARRNTLVISPYCVISLVKIFIFIEWLYSTPKVYVM